MTTTKQRKIRVLLDELIHNLDSAFYWANEYDLNIERIIDYVRCLII